MSDLTSGDPLKPEEPRREGSGGGLWSGASSQPAPEAPPTPPAEGYGSGPVPPGAFAPRPSHAPRTFELAGFGPRVAAAVVDALILAAVAGLLLVIGFAVLGTVDTDGGAVAFIVVALVLTLGYFVASLLYAPVLMHIWDGQTIGKRMFGIRVVRAGGQRMDFLWAALREVAVKSLLVGVVASLTFGVVWLINYLWPLWDAENRAGHDFVVDTRVVKA